MKILISAFFTYLFTLSPSFAQNLNSMEKLIFSDSPNSQGFYMVLKSTYNTKDQTYSFEKCKSLNGASQPISNEMTCENLTDVAEYSRTSLLAQINKLNFQAADQLWWDRAKISSGVIAGVIVGVPLGFNIAMKLDSEVGQVLPLAFAVGQIGVPLLTGAGAGWAVSYFVWDNEEKAAKNLKRALQHDDQATFYLEIDGNEFPAFLDSLILTLAEVE